MTGRKFLLILLLLTSHRSASQDHPTINISLASHDIAYSAFICPSMVGMIHGKDHLMLSGNLTIHGFDSPFIATFGLFVEQDIGTRLAMQIESSSCAKVSNVKMDTCVCTYLDINKLDFKCNLTASCKMSGHLYFYMNYNNTYYYTKSISILQTHARCESPPGPFSICFDGKEKRTITYPFDTSRARYSCNRGLLHGVDRFNMTGLINLKDIPGNTVIDVHFGMMPINDKNSLIYFGTDIHFRYRSCVPIDLNVVNSCGCLGVEPDGFRVGCTLLASLEQNQKYGFFQMYIAKPYYYYMGDLVMMPLILDECGEIPSSGTASQDHQNINITLASYVIDYSNFSCPTLEGLIQGADHMELTGKLNISGFNSSFNATFGLLAEHDSYNRLIRQIELECSNDPQHSKVRMDTCVCTYFDINKLDFTCNLTASCKMSGNLHFYMNYNNIYYYTDSISILKIYARCESPPGPFSLCVNGKEKRCVTYPFDHSHARYSCLKGLLHGVDHFKMMGRVNLYEISSASQVFVNFSVASRRDTSSVIFLGRGIHYQYGNCQPFEQNDNYSCECREEQFSELSVVCQFLASLEHSQKFGFFQMSVDGRKYVGDFVRMPLVFDVCREMSGHLPASQGDPKINISLESHDIAYGAFTCPSMVGMIHGKDHLMLFGKLIIYGLDSAFNATFGLLVERDIDKSPATQIEISSCTESSVVKIDTCVCTYMDINDLDFRCNVTATCQMSGNLYVFMNLNDNYYYTNSIAILKTHALCESPPGPFSNCFNGKEKRIVTYPFNRSQARYVCRTGLINGVDRFIMMGRIYINDIPRNTVIDVHFAVVPMYDNSSVRILGKGIHFRYRSCVPLDQNVNNTCACHGVERGGYRVVCTLLASVEHSQKYGFFQMLIDGPYYYYRGDYVMMPLVLGPQSPSQNHQNINVSLGRYVIDYSNLTCPRLEGLIHGADHMVLTGNLNICGFNSSLNATFGLLAEKDSYNRLVTEIELECSNDPRHSEVRMDTCICTYLDINKLDFTCNLTASCQMSGNLHFYMNYNNIYYYTDSISILKIFARCESPPEAPLLPRLMYITTMFLLVVIMAALTYKFVCSKSGNMYSQGADIPEEKVEEKCDVHSNVVRESSVDTLDIEGESSVDAPRPKPVICGRYTGNDKDKITQAIGP